MSAPVVILDRPQLAENIGAVARAMGNFGLHELRLVAPRDGWPQDRAWAAASGADWPLRDARVFGTVADAVADLQLVYAATARPRETQLPVLTPRQGAAELRAAVAGGLRSAWLFGAERAGLETMDIALCQGIVTIPIDPKFRSLNLAQAVVVNAYEWWTNASDAPPPNFQDDARIADGAMMMGVFQHLEGELETSGFFFPPEKKPSMVRNLRVTLNRARLTEQEARTFRGVITALTRGRGRTLARLASERDTGGDDDGVTKPS
jgi:tRNA/rRNA methyltransferase